MKATLRLCLGTLCIIGGTMQGSENPSTTSEQISQALATISTSSNPSLEPLKDALADVGSHALRRGGKDSGDAAPAGAHRINKRAPRTPFTTPLKPRSPGSRHRPNPICADRMQDTGLGLGNLDLSHFESRSQEPLLQKEVDTIVQSITKLEASSATALNKINELTEEEKKAVEFINKNSRHAINPNTVNAAILGAGIFGALAWAARINPMRIYQKECTKFTGLEFPALIAAGKALIGPLVAIIGLGIFWYKFKQWIVEPYEQAHQTEIAKFKEALAKHKSETEKTHNETLHAINSLRETIERAERGQRAQLEHTLTELSKTENQLKQQFVEFTTQATANIESIAGNIHDLQRSRDALKEQTTLLISKHAAVLETIKPLKEKLTETSQTLKTVKENQTNILRIMDRVKSTSPSPHSAPVGGRAPSPSIPVPHSANIPRPWFGRRSSKITPLPQLSPTLETPQLTVNTRSPSDEKSESKRAPLSAPAAVAE